MYKPSAMSRGSQRLLRSAFVFVLVLSLLGLVACRQQATSTSKSGGAATAGLRTLQQAKYLKASLYGVTSMEFNQIESVTYPLLLGVPSVPIVWMGPIFDSRLDKVGPGGEMNIQVHGRVSDDGAWIENLTYSEQIASAGAGNTVFYQVILRMVPIDQPKAGEKSVAGTFDKVGGDVQKHVEQLQYFQLGAPAMISYTSIDWNTTVDNQQPKLKVAFEIVPSEDLGAVGAGGGM